MQKHVVEVCGGAEIPGLPQLMSRVGEQYGAKVTNSYIYILFKITQIHDSHRNTQIGALLINWTFLKLMQLAKIKINHVNVQTNMYKYTYGTDL